MNNNKVIDMGWNTNNDFELKFLGNSDVTHICTMGFWDLIKMAFSINNKVIKLKTPLRLIIIKDSFKVGYIKVDSTLKIKRGS